MLNKNIKVTIILNCVGQKKEFGNELSNLVLILTLVIKKSIK